MALPRSDGVGAELEVDNTVVYNLVPVERVWPYVRPMSNWKGRDAMVRSPCRRFVGTLLAVAVSSVPAHAGIQIDFDVSGRQSSEVTEPGWSPWVVSSATSLAVSGVTFKIAKAGSASNLTTVWSKAMVQAPNYARVIGDGVSTDATSNGAIQLTISGLSAGTHSLLAYHNSTDGTQWGDVSVSVDGSTKASGIVPSKGALLVDNSGYSHVSFAVAAEKSVTIVYSSSKKLVVNGLLLDVPDPKHQASGCYPLDRDWHADGDSGYITLSWKAASGAKSHGVYIGADSASVEKATTSSSLHKGSQTGTTYKLVNPSVHKTWWWRIDETDANGNVVPGRLWAFERRRLAFPDAEGYGRYAHGGRGGKVVHVTNLNDAGAGSLREAVENSIGPRTIVFDVGGVITLKSRLTITDSRITYAGQTAPGKGIVIRGCSFGTAGMKDGIVRFNKVRVGYTGNTWDGTGLTGADFSIMDHVSQSWAIDEGFSSRGGKNLTLQRTMIAEQLNVANHQKYPAGTGHGYAATIGGDVGSFHHNLLAHNEGRNWSLGGGLDAAGYYAGRLDIFNNVVYNWGGRATDGGAHEVNFVANYYKEGAATTQHNALKVDLEGAGKGSQAYYYHGNVLQAPGGSFTCDGSKDDCGRTYTLSNGQVLDWTLWNAKPFFPSYAKIQSAKDAYKDVLSDVGMTMPVFDDHDKRIIQETLTGKNKYKGSVSGKSGIPDRESDVGGYESYPTTSRPSGFDSDYDGMPDWWESFIGTNAKSASGDFSESNADRDDDGYTNLEEYLEWMAAPHVEAAVGKTVTFDLSTLTAGYTNGPTFKVSTSACADLTVSGSTLSISPKSACGVTYPSFTVTDKEGSSKTRRIGLFVTGSVTTGVARTEVAPDWRLENGRYGFYAPVAGRFKLRNVSGRQEMAVDLVADQWFSLPEATSRVRIAEFQGQGVRVRRVLLPVAR